MSLIFTLWILFIGSAIFTALGTVILACVPFFRVTFVNLLVFVAMAVPGGIISWLLLGNLILSNQPIGRPPYGLFAVLVRGGVSLGALAVWLKMRIASALEIDSPR
jgi:hypothetical protein